MPSILDQEKAALRERAKLIRAEAFARHGASAGAALARHGLSFTGRMSGIVSGFSAIGDEIDCRPLMLGVEAAGFTLALPVITGKARPLTFRAYRSGDPLVARQWGIEEPLDTAPVVVPDIVLVPLLAFDHRGYRLGYGGGFYDRSLAEIRASKPAIAVGVGFDEQRVAAVPVDAYDQSVAWMLTPSGPLRCQRED